MLKVEIRAELNQQPNESLQTPEIPIRNMKKMVVLSGPSYAGKSVLSEYIEEKDGYVVEDGHATFTRRTGIEAGEMKKTPQAHKRFDGIQAKAFRTTTEEQLTAGEAVGWWQTRLAGIIAAEVMDIREKQIDTRDLEIARAKRVGKEIPETINTIPIVTVLITADLDVRVDRAHTEAVEEALENDKPIPSRTSVKELVLQRERKNVKDWSPNHPSRYVKQGASPYYRYKKRPNEQPVYMLVIDTSKHKSVKETYKELMRDLEAFDVFESLTIAEVDSAARKTHSEQKLVEELIPNT